MAGRSLKAAPRRTVREVERRGDWGEVTYHHHLSCGHTEVRKRQAPTVVLACSGCLRAAEFAAAPLREVREVPTGDPLVDDVATLEGEVARVKAALANRLGVEPDAVSVAANGTLVANAMVFLDASTAYRLAGLDKSVSV
jgi:hypothetical protein